MQIVGPDAAELSQALSERGVALGRGSTVTVVASGRAGGRAGSAAVVGIGPPYPVAEASAPVRLVAYGDVPVSIEALADVLAGRTPAPGRPPVPLDTVSDC